MVPVLFSLDIGKPWLLCDKEEFENIGAANKALKKIKNSIDEFLVS